MPNTNFIWGQVSETSQYCVGALMGNGNLPTSSGNAATSSAPSDEPETSDWILGAAYMRGVYTVFRSGSNGEQPSVGFAPIKGVNYNTNATPTIGIGGDGVNGRIGQAGVIITGTGEPTQAPSLTNTGSGNQLTTVANARTSVLNNARPATGALGTYLIWTIMLVIGCALNW